MTDATIFELKPEFARISISPDILAGILNDFVIEGSQKNRVIKADLKPFIPIGAKEVAITLELLIAGGTCFFDAVYYMAIVGERPTPEEKPRVEIDWDKMAQDLFILYFVLITQGRAVAAGVQQANFIASILTYTESYSDVANRLASFALDKINHSWIKRVTVDKMGPETLNRFGLGVAGYRYLSAVAYDVPNRIVVANDTMSHGLLQTLIDEAATKRAFVLKFLQKGYHWYVHPVTRTPEFIGRFGSLNKCLIDMLCFLFTQETLRIMVDQKVIYSMPVAEARFRQWRNWDEATFKFVDDLMFSGTEVTGSE